VSREAWTVLIGAGADVQVLAAITEAGGAGLAAAVDRWGLPSAAGRAWAR